MKLAATRHIDRPADDVFEFFADASNNPSWQSGMVSCEWTSEPPIAVGSTYEQTAKFMGREVRSSFIVTEYEPGHAVTIETTKSTFPIQVTRAVEPIDDSSCRVSADISGGPDNWFFRFIGPIVRRRAQRSVDADYDRLVQVLES